jgi:manganese/iron transport system substrate-binding protein
VARFILPLLGLSVLVALVVGPLRPWQFARTQAGPLRVATSITPLADLIENVGGERVEVTALVPLGDDPEGYDPTPADAARVNRARVFFENGLGLEGYLEDLIESAGNGQLEVVTLSEGLPALGGFGQGAEEGGNPHLWLDPRRAISYVEVIRDALSDLDPEGASVYVENAGRYTAQLVDLDKYIEQQVLTIPPAGRVLVTTHDALPYFAERYGFIYLAVVNANPESDPSAQEYASLVRTVQENKVKAVFGEAGFSGRFISQLAADTGATYVADLYTDTLSDGPPGDAYLNAMRHNAEAIVGALR